MRKAEFPMWMEREFCTKRVRKAGVSRTPLLKEKTGRLGFNLPCFNPSKSFIAAIGQQLCPRKLKISTISPFLVLFLGIFMSIVRESSLRVISCQSTVSQGLNFLSFLARNSPSLREPKNAIKQADQKTALSSVIQSDLEISCPSSFSNGRDMAFLDSLTMPE